MRVRMLLFNAQLKKCLLLSKLSQLAHFRHPEVLGKAKKWSEVSRETPTVPSDEYIWFRPIWGNVSSSILNKVVKINKIGPNQP